MTLQTTAAAEPYVPPVATGVIARKVLVYALLLAVARRVPQAATSLLAPGTC